MLFFGQVPEWQPWADHTVPGGDEGHFPAGDIDKEKVHDTQSLEHHGGGRHTVLKKKSVQKSLGLRESSGERVYKSET